MLVSSPLTSQSHLIYHVADLDVPDVDQQLEEIEKYVAKALNCREQSTEEAEGRENEDVPPLDEHIQHRDILRLSEQLKGLERDLKPMNEKYQNSYCLPPDIHLAKIKIEELKRESKRLEDELNRDIDELLGL